MRIFEKNKKTSKNPSEQQYKKEKDEYYSSKAERDAVVNKENTVKKQEVKPSETKIKKRKKIGIRSVKKVKDGDEFFRKEKRRTDEQKVKIFNIKDDEVVDVILNDEQTSDSNIEKEKNINKTQKKKKSIIKKDMRGKPVYLEDTGEKLGVVYDSVYDKNRDLVGYKIKDKKSNAVLSFPYDQFIDDKDGLIFVPGWYNNAMKIIEKLEFKDKISPELTALISDDTISNKELYDIFVKHDDDMAKYIDDAISLKEVLYNRLKVLERQRLSLKDDLMDLTEKRLIRDIDRREFSQDVMEHRRKVNILDVNINKCKDLLKRLDITSFGMLGKDRIVLKPDMNNKENKQDNVHHYSEGKKQMLFSEDLQIPYKHHDVKEKKQVTFDDIQISYKKEYYALKEQFDQLEEEYQELKSSVEKIFGKDES